MNIVDHMLYWHLSIILAKTTEVENIVPYGIVGLHPQLSGQT